MLKIVVENSTLISPNIGIYYYSDVIVIPIELEIPSEIDAFTKFEILDGYGRTYKSWIQQCYLHRMREILTNPTEFGKVVLEEKKRYHCIQDEEGALYTI